jgi:hypothetical protein
MLALGGNRCITASDRGSSEKAAATPPPSPQFVLLDYGFDEEKSTQLHKTKRGLNVKLAQ